MYFNLLGTKLILLLSSLISSTPLLLAASISMISGLLFKTSRQFSHSKQIDASSLKFKQLIVLATNLAIVVLPVPRGPENK